MLANIAVGWTIVFVLHHRSRYPSNSTYDETFKLPSKWGLLIFYLKQLFSELFHVKQATTGKVQKKSNVRTRGGVS